MKRFPMTLLTTTALALAGAACGSDAADEAEPSAGDAASEARAEFVEVGEPAPDFELRAATRYGVLDEPVSLSDFRGKTVVLAFFFRARGSG
ncbi:MAG: hypothetical protein U5R14_03250 [Gemmatimonadota bacterium]|nr:hypothetical protein [Gemmatimonadota bacterium]